MRGLKNPSHLLLRFYPHVLSDGFQDEIRPQFEAKYSKKERMNPISGKPEPYQAFTDKYSRLMVSASGIFFMVGFWVTKCQLAGVPRSPLYLHLNIYCPHLFLL